MTLNIGKLIGLCVAMICVTVLLITDSIEQDVGRTILTAITFYLIGNGVNAKRGKQDVAVIGPKPEGRRADDSPDE